MKNCWIVSPPYTYKPKNWFNNFKMIIWHETITNIIIQNSQFEKTPSKMLSSSLIFLQQKKLKNCRNTNVLNKNVKWRLWTLYLSKYTLYAYSPLIVYKRPSAIVPSAIPLKYFADRSLPITESNSSWYSGRKVGPTNSKIMSIIIWKIVWPIICFIILFVIRGEFRECGLSCSNFYASGG